MRTAVIFLTILVGLSACSPMERPYFPPVGETETAGS